MDKNKLLKDFSYVCGHIADKFEKLLLPNLDDDMHMITPQFWDAHIPDLDQWWTWNDHFAKYIAQLDETESQIPGAMQENIDAGIEEVQESLKLWKQLKNLTGNPDYKALETLKHIPHVAQYARCAIETDGFKKLDDLTQRMDNVFLWPMVTLNNKVPNLKQAFYLNVAVVSGDGSSLKPKIQKFRRLDA